MNISRATKYPKVSIITPSLNQVEYIEDTINSVINQTYPNIEYIIIDGGSTDGTLEVINRYQSQISYWKSEQDSGQAEAINKGLRVATGEFVGWLNSDDLLYPEAVESVVSTLLRRPDIDLIYGDIDTGSEPTLDAHVLSGENIDVLSTLKTLSIPMPQQGSLWRRIFVDRIGLLDERLHVTLDREFFLRAAVFGRVFHLPEKLGFFRLHENAKSTRETHKWLSELPQMYERFYERKDLVAEIKATRQQAMGAVFLICASIAFQNKSYFGVFKYIISSLGSDPLVLLRPFIWRKFFENATIFFSKGFRDS